MKKQRSFTLVEVLIVVIILAILAAIFFPRFINQTENAYITEAQRTLGVLHRAEVNVLDQGLTLPALTSTDTQADMLSLGLKGISATNFTYTCEANGVSCTATSTRNTSATITMTLAGDWSCDGATYTAIAGNKGCRPAA